MKITFLTGEYPPMQGGIADHTAYLAQHLTQPNIATFILTNDRWQETETDGPQPLVPGVGRQPIIQPLLTNWGWRCWRGVDRFLNTYHPDILHIQYQAAAFDLGGWVNWLPWYLRVRRFKTKIVTTFHDLRIPYIFPKGGAFRWYSMLALARYSHAVICTNREDMLTLAKQLSMNNEQLRMNNEQSPVSNLRIPQSSYLPSSIFHSSSFPLLILIPLGSNVEPQPPPDFERATWRARYQADEKTLLLAYFGFLNESKGGEELIESLALLRQQGTNTRLLFIGGDVGHADPTNVAYGARVQAMIERHNLQKVVHRTGYIDEAAVSANLLAADVLVMPYRDGVSFRRTTLIAALRHGCPIISTTPTDPSLIPEIRPGENMLLTPPQDAVALAETIAPLADDTALRERLSVGARQLGNLFEWQTIAEQTKTLYQTILRNA